MSKNVKSLIPKNKLTRFQMQRLKNKVAEKFDNIWNPVTSYTVTCVSSQLNTALLAWLHFRHLFQLGIKSHWTLQEIYKLTKY